MPGTRIGRAALVGALLTLPIGSALAQERSWPSQGLRGGPIPDGPPCSCRGPRGGAVEVGQEVCLVTASGARRARCIMVVNNTSWEVQSETCTPEGELTN